MAIYAQIAGTGKVVSIQDRLRQNASIGITAQQVGLSIEKVAPALATIPVVGQIAAIGANFIGQIIAMFGSNYSTSTGVRWLTQLYQYYVLGQSGATSDNHVDESYTAAAQKWFSYVLGVPIYDRYRLSALKGIQGISDSDLNNSDAQRAANYLAYADTAGVSQAAAMQAVQLAKGLQFNNIPGSWASALVAPSLVGTTATNSTTGTSGGGAVTIQTGAPPVSDNTGLFLVLAAAAVGYYFLIHKKSGR